MKKNDLCCIKNRDHSIDSVAGIMILIMVFGHILQHCELKNSEIYTIWRNFNFFMPWFFFKSGMFYRAYDNVAFISKYVQKLLYPFLVFSLLGHFFHCITMFFEYRDYNWIHYFLSPAKHLALYGCLAGNEPLWFLLTLFFVLAIYNFIMKNQTKTFLFKMSIVVIAILISFLFERFNIRIFSYFFSTMVGLAFFSFGNIFCDIQYNKKIFSLILLLLIDICNIEIPVFYIHSNVLTKGNYILWIIYSLAACIVINNVFKLIGGGALRYIGQNAMIIYLTHWIVITTSISVAHIFNPNVESLTLFIITCFCCFIILSILSVFHNQLKKLLFVK